MNLSDLHLAVQHADTKSITKIPGIGKKMAERLVLELRDKFQKQNSNAIEVAESSSSDATNALINLGYKPQDAQKAISKILSDRKEEPPLAELISLALKARQL
jgi:holliday junction DNA helicase RuvA